MRNTRKAVNLRGFPVESSAGQTRRTSGRRCPAPLGGAACEVREPLNYAPAPRIIRLLVPFNSVRPQRLTERPNLRPLNRRRSPFAANRGLLNAI
ncbi:Hypothetical protein NTJ_00353 [Nesidiocoris tenuis]|uniref:Uncharacterized protein n=1 Tax=Nesidiocoris tenuis TaxID=355587 RepID=A0ABN7A6L5_9HEMI|nr:Hypothetical protein NTJ_00353 [Nesidiocoris tenuis]